MDSPRMRVAVGQIRDLNDDKLRFAAQLGVTGVHVNTPLLPGETHWEVDDLRGLVSKCEAYGLNLEAIENVPPHFYDKAMLGLPGRDEQIENYQTTVRNCGAAGVPILGLHFMPNFVWRTDWAAPGRGGSRSTRFDMNLVDAAQSRDDLLAYMPLDYVRKDEIPLTADADAPIKTSEEMWQNYVYFMNAVLPVAEAAGVKIAVHPDDPPVPTLGGVGRIFNSPAGFKRAYELNPESPSWGLNLCLGCCSEMPGGKKNVIEMIEYFGPKGKIHYSHFRDVQGELPVFQECFIGEGNYDPAEIALLLKKSGFKGFLLDDHVPIMDGDSEWGHRARGHAIGYMQGLLRMMEQIG